MICCGECFKDRGLRKEIVPQLSEAKGRCPTCGAEEQHLVEARKLGDYFELLCGIYRPDGSGKVLVDWLVSDWEIFKLERAQANSLLVEILDDGERVREALVPSDLCKTDRLDGWQSLRDELRHKNRFFPQTEFNHDRLEELLSNLMVDADDLPTTWSRARIEDKNQPFLAVEMGAPPKEITSHGRANPAGIPYLYLGSTTITAIAEVRPHPGERVCVAEYSLEENLQIVDLRNPRMLVSPFLLGDEAAIGLMRGDIEFLERLGQELTTPVLPNAAAIDYIPSQYLCEFIKKCGYHGVLYSSSVSTGMNLALFDHALAAVGKVLEFKVDKLSFEYSEVV